MLSKKMEQEFNKQINAEMFSAYLYLSMQAYFESVNLKGFANWMNVQFQEEQFHAMKLYNFINERGGRVTLAAIDAPDTEWKDSIAVFAKVYEHEQLVTSLINNLMNVAIEEKDHASANFLQWFVGEQVEEEANASDLLEQLKLIEGKGHGLLMIDRELRQRVFNAPAEAAE